MSNPWAQLNEMQAKFNAEFASTKAAIKELGGTRLRADEFGNWHCSHSREGDRAEFVARSSAELVEKLKEHVKPEPARQM